MNHIVKIQNILKLWKLRNLTIATFETKTRDFQYELLNNVLYLNKKLFHFGIISQCKCSFCKLHDETPQHLFYECTYAQNSSNQVRLHLSEKFALPVLNPQSAIFGFTDVLHHNYLLLNHLLLIILLIIISTNNTQYVNNTLSFQSLKLVISQIKYIEETMNKTLFY